AGAASSEGGERVPTYIMLTSLTSDGVKTIKNHPGRVHEVNKEMEQLGVKVVSQWATLGEYDFVSVVEAPDEKTMAKVSVELGSRGTTTNETMSAIPAEEFTKALGARGSSSSAGVGASTRFSVRWIERTSGTSCCARLETPESPLMPAASMSPRTTSAEAA